MSFHTLPNQLMQEENYSFLVKKALDSRVPMIAYEFWNEYYFLTKTPSTRMLDLLFSIHQHIQDINYLIYDTENMKSHLNLFSENTFLQLITAFASCKEFEKAYDLFKLAIAQGIKPNVFFYNSLISVANSTQAKKLRLKMEKEKIIPNLLTYFLLADIYSESEQDEDMEFIIKDMIHSGVLPTSEFLARYLQQITSIENYSNRDFGNLLMDIVEHINIIPEQSLFDAFTLYYSVVHSPEQGKQYIEYCKKIGYLSDDLYLGVFQGYVSFEDVDGAIDFANELEEIIEKDNLVGVYKALLDLAIVKDPVKAISILLKMDDLLIAPDLEIYDTLLGALLCAENVKYFDVIFEVWDRAAVFGAPISQETMEEMVRTADKLQAPKQIPHLLTYMDEREMNITEELVAICNKPITSVIDENAFDIKNMSNFKE